MTVNYNTHNTLSLVTYEPTPGYLKYALQETDPCGDLVQFLSLDDEANTLDLSSVTLVKQAGRYRVGDTESYWDMQAQLVDLAVADLAGRCAREAVEAAGSGPLEVGAPLPGDWAALKGLLGDDIREHGTAFAAAYREALEKALR